MKTSRNVKFQEYVYTLVYYCKTDTRGPLRVCRFQTAQGGSTTAYVQAQVYALPELCSISVFSILVSLMDTLLPKGTRASRTAFQG